jgi:hypothetical protein
MAAVSIAIVAGLLKLIATIVNQASQEGHPPKLAM